MAKLELTLHDGKGYSKTYTEDQVSGQKLLDFWDMQIRFEKEAGKLTAPDIIGIKAEYVASLFKSEEVTAESIIKGVNSWDLIETIDNLIMIAIGGDKEDPKELEGLPQTVDSAI